MKILLVLVFSFSLFSIIRSQVIINEVCSSNSSNLADPDFGKYGDWIELYNSGDEWLNIGDWFLSDDSSELSKWQIPSETFLAPNSFKLIFADGRNIKLHTNFSLDKGGEKIFLADTSLFIIDSITVPYLLNDMSYGRFPSDENTYSVFTKPTPGVPNNGVMVLQIASFVKFSLSGGFYKGPIKLGLSYPGPGQIIYYTTDGSYPTRNSKIYSDSIGLTSNSVIRAICFEDGKLDAVAVTQTYFIDEQQNLPVFSLVTDPEHLYSDETGIMVKGTAGVPGYCTSVPHNLNNDWERPVNLEFFEDNGSQVINQMCGTKIFGGCSRIRYPQKSLAFYARSKYETSSFDYQLFPDKPAERYESFILRASGDDQPRTLFRDALTQMLVKDVIDVDVQGYRPVVLYINGEYNGIINMREKLNEHYPENNYGLDADHVDVLRRNPVDSWNVIAGSADHYNAMMDYIRSNDIRQASHYNYIATQMDIDEYINYQVIQIFFGGRDWPGNNIKFWRSSEEPYKRWRWILYDLDAHSMDAVGNIMEEATEDDCACTWPNPPWSTYLFRTLLENDEFASKFIERFNTYTNTVFSRERLLEKINEMQNHLAPEIPRHIERWGGQRIDDPDNTWMVPVFNSVEEWNGNVQVMRDFAALRHETAIQQVNEYFGIEGTKFLKINNSDTSASTILLGATPMYNSEFIGYYSTGTSINIEAIVDPGFLFSKWEKVNYISKDSLLISKGDAWRYYDGGNWLDQAWTTLDYNDASWAPGNAEFGYGDGDENTVVDFGPDPNNKHITYNFRKKFQIPDTASIDVYELQILRDDASVIYLNGIQVVKENMPQYGHDNTTLAASTIAGADEKKFLIYNLNAELFRQGENIISVEIHQAGATSSDISFDLQLKASRMVAESVSIHTAPKIKLDLSENIGLRAIILPDTNVVQNVFINEVISSNSNGYKDENNEFEDWIEFYNAGTEPVNMAGMMLADTIPYEKLWHFPQNASAYTTIEKGGYLLVIADNEPEEGILHSNFRLSNMGEEISLLQKIGHDTVIIDQIEYKKQYPDLSWGRFPDGAASFQWMLKYTPWAENIWQPLSESIINNVFINEIMASNIDKYADEAGDFEDWIEIYNAGDEPVNLAGYFLADSFPIKKKWQFPVNNDEATTISPDSFIVVFADGEPLEGPLHAGFKLNGDGEELLLFQILAEDTTIIDHLEFGYQYNNVSWGRYPDGSDNFQYMPVNTPWYSNLLEKSDTNSVEDYTGNEIQLFPNPAHDVFYLNFNELNEQEVVVSIYTISGSMVLKSSCTLPGKVSFSLEGKEPGIYIIDIQGSRKRWIRKIIIK